MSPEAARAAALSQAGQPHADPRGDLRDEHDRSARDCLAGSAIWRAPAASQSRRSRLVAILTLALGTGANAAIFQLVDAVRLRTLPVKHPEQLVEISIDTNGKGRTGSFISRRPLMTEPLWRAVRERQQAFSELLAWGTVTFDLASSGESRPAQGLWVSGDFFQTLGVHAHIGRVLTPADDQKGCAAPGVVLSHAFWQKQYSGDPSIVGRSIDARRPSVRRDWRGADAASSALTSAAPSTLPRRFAPSRSAAARAADSTNPTCGSSTCSVGSRTDGRWNGLKRSCSQSLHRCSRRRLPPHFTPVDTASYLAFKLIAQSGADWRVVGPRRLFDAAVGSARRHGRRSC